MGGRKPDIPLRLMEKPRWSPARYLIVASGTDKCFSNLQPPFRLSDFADGVGYRVGWLKLHQPSLFVRVGSLGDLVVKTPSIRGMMAFETSVKLEIRDPQDIRQNEPDERFQNLQQTLQRFPSFSATCANFGEDVAHFLVVHNIQYARLQAAGIVAIPESRFIVLQWRRLCWRYAAPAIVQERISGIRLWDMVVPTEGVSLPPQYSHLKADLARQLGALISSNIAIHIDWNIQNFIWNEPDKRLYYVDCKPTTIGAKWGVDQNLEAIREVFLTTS